MPDLGTRLREHYEPITPPLDTERLMEQFIGADRYRQRRRPVWAMAAAAVLTLVVIGAVGLMVLGNDEEPDVIDPPTTVTTATTPPTTVPSNADPVAVVERLLTAWSTNDFDTYQAQYALEADARRLYDDPIFGVSWRDHYGGDEGAFWDVHQFWMAFNQLIETETTWDCDSVSPDVVESPAGVGCDLFTTNALTEHSGFPPVTWEWIFVLEGDKVVQEARYQEWPFEYDLRTGEFSTFEALRAYQVWAYLRHPDQWDELFVEPLGWGDLVYSPDAITIHEQLLSEYLDASRPLEDTTEAVEVVERMLHARADNDVDTYRAQYAEDAVFVDPWGTRQALFGADSDVADDFDGDGVMTMFDTVQFDMALGPVFDRKVLYECRSLSSIGAYCRLTTTDVFVQRSGPDFMDTPTPPNPTPVSTEMLFAVDEGLIVEERTMSWGPDSRRNAEVMGYERWVLSDHPDLSEQLYRPSEQLYRPVTLENYIRLPETIPIHAQLMAEYLASH